MVAVAVAGIAYFIIGALWYSVLFGKLWIKLMNVSPEELTPPGSKMIYVVAGTFITAYIMDIFSSERTGQKSIVCLSIHHSLILL